MKTIRTSELRGFLAIFAVAAALATLAWTGLANASADLEKAALKRLIWENASPGASRYSVEVARDCAECEAVWSPHYSARVTKESAETAKERFGVIVEELVDGARRLLCEDAPCVPYGGEVAWKSRQPWTVEDLLLITTTVIFHESGFREDVQTGRGRSGRPSKAGGEGRGPGNEACLVQIHPDSAWRFLDPSRKPPNPKEREALAASLLGTDAGSVRRCLVTGMKMLIHSRAYCAWKEPTITSWSFATFSMYGSGVTCGGWKGTAAREKTLWSLRRKYAAIKATLAEAVTPPSPL